MLLGSLFSTAVAFGGQLVLTIVFLIVVTLVFDNLVWLALVDQETGMLSVCHSLHQSGRLVLTIGRLVLTIVVVAGTGTWV